MNEIQMVSEVIRDHLIELLNAGEDPTTFQTYIKEGLSDGSVAWAIEQAIKSNETQEINLEDSIVLL